MFTATLLMAYPQTMDVLNFSDAPFDEKDYKICQSLMLGVWVIGYIFFEHGLPHILLPVLQPLMKPPAGIANTDPKMFTLFFNMRSAIARFVVVPILLLVAMLTFGSDNSMIQALCGLFWVFEPVAGVMTVILVRKCGHYEEEKDEAVRTTQFE